MRFLDYNKPSGVINLKKLKSHRTLQSNKVIYYPLTGLVTTNKHIVKILESGSDI